MALLPLLIEKTSEQLAEKGMFFKAATDASNSSDGCFLHQEDFISCMISLQDSSKTSLEYFQM